MLYGESYKRSLRDPTEKEKEDIAKIATRLCGDATVYHRNNIIFAAFVGVSILVTLILGWMNNFLQILIFIAVAAISAIGIVDSSYHIKNAQINMAKLASGEYGIANGWIIACALARGKVRMIGKIGDEELTEIEFYLDKKAHDNVRFVDDFVCVVVHKTTYAVLKDSKNKMIVSDDVHICNRYIPKRLDEDANWDYVV